MEKFNNGEGRITRQKLADAFWDLYEKKNINEIRIQNITDRAGYHRSTFYLYYTDIYGLLHSEIDSIISDLKERSQKFKYLTQEGTVHLMADFYGIHQKKLFVLFYVHSNNEFLAQYQQLLYPSFKENFSTTDKRPGEIEMICNYALQGSIASFCEWYQMDKETRMSLTQLTEFILAPPKGL